MEGCEAFGEPWRGGHQLEMPIFSGENLEGWIFRAELFFEMNHLTEMEKMMAAEVTVEVEALA